MPICWPSRRTRVRCDGAPLSSARPGSSWLPVCTVAGALQSQPARCTNAPAALVRSSPDWGWILSSLGSCSAWFGAHRSTMPPLGYACLPKLHAEAVDLLDHEAAERTAFTLPQLQKLLAKASTDWTGMILLGYYCGFRRIFHPFGELIFKTTRLRVVKECCL